MTPSTLFAASPEALVLQRTPIVTFGYVMQVFFSLLVVLALLYFIARFVLPRMKLSSSGKLIKVLDRVYLEPQVSAYLLQVGRDAWLIAASNKNITRIDKVDLESPPTP
ncbi:MAG: FliO/MopB family protein [Candidatus Saganbacteria bacterium]|nr:FliO/MopB family protein [Candidatus Saganbacteria bacterium]